MSILDSRVRFGVVSILNHWLTAVVVISALVLGLLLENFPKGDEEAAVTTALLTRRDAIGIHEALGIAVLALVAFRILWRLINSMPQPANDARPWEILFARSIHVLLIAAMVIMPMSGWIMANSGGHPVQFLGLFTLPELVGKNHELHEVAEGIHGLTGNLMIALISIHALAALKHHFIDKDSTLQRMLGRGSEVSAASH